MSNYEEYIVRVYQNRTEWCNTKDQLHRLDGPALEYADGSKEWYQNGKRHRLDGSAIEWADGTKEWYIDGKLLSEQEFIQRTAQQTSSDNCDGRVIVIDGKEYRLVRNKKE